MPRTTRTTEMAQRPFPRSGPPSLRTSSSSDSDSLHQRSRLSGNKSPRGSQSDPVKQQKKLGSRIADLESQLGQAQDELKCLKNQLASAESVKKKAAQQQHENKSKKQQQVPVPVVIEKREESGEKQGSVCEHEMLPETDVFEVPIEKVSLEPKTEPVEMAKQEDLKDKLNEPQEMMIPKLDSKDDEIHLLRTKLEEKDKEIEAFRQENDNLKTQLNGVSEKISPFESQVEELKTKLQQAEQELQKSKTNAAHINEKLATTEKARQELENEMKSLRVQTEQWRKAADAAAYFLSGGMETSDSGGRRVSERCGSMDKVYYGNSFEPVGSYGSMRSPGFIDDSDDVFGGGKKKSSSGIRMLGDLWKKKGQK